MTTDRGGRPVWTPAAQVSCYLRNDTRHALLHRKFGIAGRVSDLCVAHVTNAHVVGSHDEGSAWIKKVNSQATGQ